MVVEVPCECAVVPTLHPPPICSCRHLHLMRLIYKYPLCTPRQFINISSVPLGNVIETSLYGIWPAGPCPGPWRSNPDPVREKYACPKSPVWCPSWFNVPRPWSLPCSAGVAGQAAPGRASGQGAHSLSATQSPTGPQKEGSGPCSLWMPPFGGSIVSLASCRLGRGRGEKQSRWRKGCL